MVAVDQNGLRDQTMVWFLSDNGGITSAASNAPHTGRKGSAFEGGNRVPFILSWPGVAQPNTDEDRLMSGLDIFPTCLAAAGGKASDNPRKLDGVDLQPYLSGKRSDAIHPALFWQRENIAAVRDGNWKLIRVRDQGIGLFNLGKKPTENDNLASSHPERVDTMSKMLDQWLSEMSEPTWHEGKGWLPKRAAMHSKEYTPFVVGE